MVKERAEEIFSKIKKEGIGAIDNFIISRTTEELFLDFKRSADNGKGRVLHQNDRNNLAKAISGFGNSEGGVMVWGIDCSKDFDGADVAKAKHPIDNVDKFVSLLQGAISGCTTPPHSKVENYAIKQAKESSGFVITLVPKSTNAPHQCITTHYYYMRAGSNFAPVPHAVLSGMFGRRPQPWVYLMYSTGPAKINISPTGEKEVLCQIGFLIHNEGLGIARDTFLNAEIFQIPGKRCKAWFDFTDTVNWVGSFSFGFKLGVICKEDFRIPPRNFAQPVVLNMTLLPPFNKNIEIKLKCGCEGSEPFDGEFNSKTDNVEKYYNEIIKTTELDKSQNLVGKLFNIKQQAKETDS
jgi:hypothetical protein